ncbi:hypothetical protein PAHAL_4G105300 [Panicum hallii]|uniref:Uncharacterized protein n=1 Tax=Panicum hallii TaxID=206008 RepID=A0A2T8JCJ2_9POAL|nr:hypothetical protein PAHAL_4G105300 [Panicum hallii]
MLTVTFHTVVFSVSWPLGFPVKVTAKWLELEKTSTETLDDVDASGSFQLPPLVHLPHVSRWKKDGLRGDARTSHMRRCRQRVKWKY